MFLRKIIQQRRGNTYTYYALVETVRSAGGRVRQRTSCYLGRLDPLRPPDWLRVAERLPDPAWLPLLMQEVGYTPPPTPTGPVRSVSRDPGSIAWANPRRLGDVYLGRNEGRQKRGAGQVADEAALVEQARSESGVSRLEQVPDPEPTPAFAAQVAEECGRLLGLLPDPELRLVAQWKMEGYNNDEIAGKLGYAVRSIERKLRLIRGVWSHDEQGP
jgi:ECF sigma factor